MNSRSSQKWVPNEHVLLGYRFPAMGFQRIGTSISSRLWMVWSFDSWGELEVSVFECGVFKYIYFHPYLGKIPILTNIFQRGWTHQLVYQFVRTLNHFLDQQQKTMGNITMNQGNIHQIRVNFWPRPEVDWETTLHMDEKRTLYSDISKYMRTVPGWTAWQVGWHPNNPKELQELRQEARGLSVFEDVPIFFRCRRTFVTEVNDAVVNT